MRIVFFGSPAFALPSLTALIEAGHDVVGVVTQPDRPAGRGHTPQPPPVKTAALAHGVPVLQPERVSSDEGVEALAALAADVFVVAAYGQILRRRVLDLPRRGCLNVHASLLPRHRGASPVAAAILAGDAVTGVTIMEMVRALDAGPMVAKVEVPVLDTDTTGTLEPRLAEAGATLLTDVIEAWAAGEITAQPQDEALSTYAPQIRRGDALLDWSLPASDLWRRVRAYHPWPIAFAPWRGVELRILEAWPVPGDASVPPGTVLPLAPLPPDTPGAGEPVFAVQTGERALAVRRIQKPGGKPLAARDFLQGQRDFIGSCFD